MKQLRIHERFGDLWASLWKWHKLYDETWEGVDDSMAIHDAMVIFVDPHYAKVKKNSKLIFSPSAHPLETIKDFVRKTIIWYGMRAPLFMPSDGQEYYQKPHWVDGVCKTSCLSEPYNHLET